MLALVFLAYSLLTLLAQGSDNCASNTAHSTSSLLSTHAARLRDDQEALHEILPSSLDEIIKKFPVGEFVKDLQGRLKDKVQSLLDKIVGKCKNSVEKKMRNLIVRVYAKMNQAETYLSKLEKSLGMNTNFTGSVMNDAKNSVGKLETSLGVKTNVTASAMEMRVDTDGAIEERESLVLSQVSYRETFIPDELKPVVEKVKNFLEEKLTEVSGMIDKQKQKTTTKVQNIVNLIRTKLASLEVRYTELSKKLGELPGQIGVASGGQLAQVVSHGQFDWLDTVMEKIDTIKSKYEEIKKKAVDKFGEVAGKLADLEELFMEKINTFLKTIQGVASKLINSVMDFGGDLVSRVTTLRKQVKLLPGQDQMPTSAPLVPNTPICCGLSLSVKEKLCGADGEDMQQCPECRDEACQSSTLDDDDCSEGGTCPFVVERGLLKNKLSTLCLDVSGYPPASMKNRKNVQIFTCETYLDPSGTDHIWMLDTDGFIRNQADGDMCLDVKGFPPASMENSRNVMIYPCEEDKLNTDTDQKWLINEEGYIQNKANEKMCLDVKGRPGTENRTNVMLYDCEFEDPDGTDQRWAFEPFELPPPPAPP